MQYGASTLTQKDRHAAKGEEGGNNEKKVDGAALENNSQPLVGEHVTVGLRDPASDKHKGKRSKRKCKQGQCNGASFSDVVGGHEQKKRTRPEGDQGMEADSQAKCKRRRNEITVGSMSSQPVQGYNKN
ncbi:hypothetical protein [Desulfonatronum thioautotrophicum]|uniref:hypothetical protein n=1 Tax=Desulfonatronum thioautotrophicum TaxID=617001 RepID=UPI001ABF0EAD|nr:hypothetical protein [Desulfonatronum thioautotrophicum]